VRTSTLFTPREPTESELAAVLEQRFDAAWFPEHHRCSIDTVDATVYVDFDPGYVAWLTPDEQHALADQLGFVPKFALHVGASNFHSGSPELAGRVLDELCRALDGRALAVA
jgi:hypothetical protein